MNHVISLDFDFWLKMLHPIEADWGHRESVFFLEVAWIARAASFLAIGKDLREEYGIVDTEELPDCFTTLLYNNNLNIVHNAVTFAESHASAYEAFKQIGDLHVIQIDAHHDMGYNGQNDKLDCGNWLMKLVEEGEVRKISMIYPKWRLDEDWRNEWEPGEEARLAKLAAYGVEVSIDYGLECLPSDLEIAHLFACRSGAWVPPWVDEDWVGLCEDILNHGEHKRYNFSGGLPGADNFYKMQREFDWDVVKIHAKQTREAFEKIKSCQIG